MVQPLNSPSLFLCLFAQTQILSAQAALPTFEEQWRPRFHISQSNTWMNDPNGLVFFDGEYHLFYQNNPHGNRWGHMSWAHSVSRDLVNWVPLPLAIAETNGVMIFSGSAVVDWKNTSGFGINGRPPLVAVYTGHHTNRPLQNQRIAYSNDRGRSWIQYAGNPVLDLGEADFRDPKVFWHPTSARWIMAVAWPQKRMIRLYSSQNLKSWTHLSDFGPAGSTTGIWECPDLFPLSVEGNSKNSKWVLVVNVGTGAHAGGSGTQYFIGTFDGIRFVTDPNSPPVATPESIPSGSLLADFEDSNYAGWTATGDAFGTTPARGTSPGQQTVDGFHGAGLANSFRGADTAQGTLVSPAFQVDRNYLNFMIGGGRQPDTAGVRLLIDNHAVRSATGNNSEHLTWHSWDLRNLRGKTARIEIFDQAVGGWVHINADHFLLSDAIAHSPSEAALWADFGADFYAAVSWSDIPSKDGRRLWIGWMSNWIYANDVPTAPWRSALSVPRELTLRSTLSGLRLFQQPVRELHSLRAQRHHLGQASTPAASEWLRRYSFRNGLAEIHIEFEQVPDSGTLTLSLRHGTSQVTQVQAHLDRHQLSLDRSLSGRHDFHPNFAAVHSAPISPRNGRLQLRILVDVSSLEIFAQDGETELTDLILPATSDLRFDLSASGSATAARVHSLTLWPLRVARLHPSPSPP
ncbi:MAG: glycoside hydrolase family 32 protein [Pedosphaera sp.]|nr:glycoside hydrolase family 32 protein [Pedosphaera sp.]